MPDGTLSVLPRTDPMAVAEAMFAAAGRADGIADRMTTPFNPALCNLPAPRHSERFKAVLAEADLSPSERYRIHVAACRYASAAAQEMLTEFDAALRRQREAA